LQQHVPLLRGEGAVAALTTLTLFVAYEKTVYQLRIYRNSGSIAVLWTKTRMHATY
jgi:hypothetical protein